jgi:transcriptional regulator with XRE-family HTH domain
MARKTTRRAPPASTPPDAEEGARSAMLTPKMLTKQEFSRRLYNMMLQRNMSQSDLARAAGLGRDAISTYINAKVFPEPKSLAKVARALGVEPHELLPNTLISAIDSEVPALEIKQAAGHPDKVWIRVNQLVDRRTAAKIFDALNSPDAVAG